MGIFVTTCVCIRVNHIKITWSIWHSIRKVHKVLLNKK